MPRSRRERIRTSLPWWLGGRETCEFCLHGYVLEMEIRCVSCDRPFCPMCEVELRQSETVLCGDCGGSEENHDG